MYERGVALGGEFRGKGAHVHLGYVGYLTPIAYDRNFLFDADELSDQRPGRWGGTHKVVATGKGLDRILTLLDKR
jgi:hypothetical protein